MHRHTRFELTGKMMKWWAHQLDNWQLKKTLFDAYSVRFLQPSPFIPGPIPAQPGLRSGLRSSLLGVGVPDLGWPGLARNDFGNGTEMEQAGQGFGMTSWCLTGSKGFIWQSSPNRADKCQTVKQNWVIFPSLPNRARFPGFYLIISTMVKKS